MPKEPDRSHLADAIHFVDLIRLAEEELPAARTTSSPLAFAGIWEFNRLGGEDLLSAAMIVGKPNPMVGGVHDRLPVMLMMEDYDRWLGVNSDLGRKRRARE